MYITIKGKNTLYCNINNNNKSEVKIINVNEHNSQTKNLYKDKLIMNKFNEEYIDNEDDIPNQEVNEVNNYNNNLLLKNENKNFYEDDSDTEYYNQNKKNKIVIINNGNKDDLSELINNNNNKIDINLLKILNYVYSNKKIKDNNSKIFKIIKLNDNYIDNNDDDDKMNKSNILSLSEEENYNSDLSSLYENHSAPTNKENPKKEKRNKKCQLLNKKKKHNK